MEICVGWSKFKQRCVAQRYLSYTMCMSVHNQAGDGDNCVLFVILFFRWSHQLWRVSRGLGQEAVSRRAGEGRPGLHLLLWQRDLRCKFVLGTVYWRAGCGAERETSSFVAKCVKGNCAQCWDLTVKTVSCVTAKIFCTKFRKWTWSLWPVVTSLRQQLRFDSNLWPPLKGGILWLSHQLRLHGFNLCTC